VIARTVGGLVVRIDETLCVGFGDCVAAAPGAFVLNGDGTVEFTATIATGREELLAACRACPVDALSVVDAAGDLLVP
jgi:ferredoxin